MSYVSDSVLVSPLDEGAAFDLEVRSAGQVTGLSVVLSRRELLLLADGLRELLDETLPRHRHEASHQERGQR